MEINIKMNKEEFIKFIESIGFKLSSSYIFYEYKEYTVSLYLGHYNFHSGSEWIYNIDLNDLTPLKKITRSIKY